MVRVYIAQKRKIQVGDKMSDVMVTKGTVSIVVPGEDIAIYARWNPIDIMLSPMDCAKSYEHWSAS